LEKLVYELDTNDWNWFLHSDTWSIRTI
jgi:hypothetical protein